MQRADKSLSFIANEVSIPVDSSWFNKFVPGPTTKPTAKVSVTLELRQPSIAKGFRVRRRFKSPSPHYFQYWPTRLVISFTM